MKKIILFFVLLMLVSTGMAKDLESNVYRRNSLCQFFISETSTNITGIENALGKTYVEYKIPDKFNDHCLNNHIMSISNIKETKDDETYIVKKGRMSFGKALATTFKEAGRQATGNSTSQLEDYLNYKVPAKLYRFCLNEHIANFLIAKWFNASKTKVDGSHYNMALIQERGAYNASELEKLRSQESIRGMALLQDAGEELIPNTYVTFTMFSFESISIKKKKKLKWTENDMNNFYTNYYNEPVEKLLNSTEFEIEYLGYHRSKGWFMSKSENVFDPKNDVPLLQQSAYRSMEKSFAELMKKYEDFRVKAPLIDVDGKTITSFIGLKEGVNKKSQFEVLMREYNPSKNRYRYKKVGTIKVDKNRIWDNRYTIEGVNFKDDDSSLANDNVDRTYFIGDTKELAPGMLIRQTK